MSPEPGDPELIHAVLDREPSEVWDVWLTVREIWRATPLDERTGVLSDTLRQCGERAPDLMPDVIRCGTASDQPVAEQRAFAGQLGLLAEYRPEEAERIYREMVFREIPASGLLTSALDGFEGLRDTRPETFALVLALTLGRQGEQVKIPGLDAARKKARSLLFAGTHSGQPAVEPLTAGLRSERGDVRRKVGEWLLPELAEKKQLGTTVLDLIEERLDVDPEPNVVRRCVAVLPKVFDRRPGQASRIVEKAWAYPDPSGADAVRDALIRSMHRAGMADRLPGQ